VKREINPRRRNPPLNPVKPGTEKRLRTKTNSETVRGERERGFKPGDNPRERGFKPGLTLERRGI